MEPTSPKSGNLQRGLHDLLSALQALLASKHPFFARLSFAAFSLFFIGWLFFVVIRLVILTRIINGFGVNILMALPVDTATASVISAVVSTVALFSIDAVVSFVLFGKDATQWRYTTISVGLLAIGASIYMKKDEFPGCYVITPDRGPVLSYPDKNRQCGPDASTTMQTYPLTPGIILSLRAMKDGVAPSIVDPATVDPNALFEIKDAHSRIWFHSDKPGDYRLFDGAGFDPGTRMPLEPVTPENAPGIREFIQHQKATKALEQQKVEATVKQALLGVEAAAERHRAQATEVARTRAEQEHQQQSDRAIAEARDQYRIADQRRLAREELAREQQARDDQARDQRAREEDQARAAKVERARREQADQEAQQREWERQVELATSTWVRRCRSTGRSTASCVVPSGCIPPPPLRPGEQRVGVIFCPDP